MVKDRLRALLRLDPGLKHLVKITRDTLVNLDDGSTIRSFSRHTGLVDGYTPTVAVVHTYANAKTTDNITTLASGQVLLPSYHTLLLSTAGFTLLVPMFQQNYHYAKKVLSGTTTATRYLHLLATQDNVQEVQHPNSWIKSLPLLHVHIDTHQITDYYTTKLSQARAHGSLNAKLVKLFKLWRQATTHSYLDFDATLDATYSTKPHIRGKRAWIGIHVGRTSDLFALTWLIPQTGWWWLDG